MRYSIIYLLTAACSIFFACTKDIEKPKKIAVTSYYYKHDTKWNLTDSGLSFHWHDVEPSILKQFEGRVRDTFCFTISTYFIHEDECKAIN